MLDLRKTAFLALSLITIMLCSACNINDARIKENESLTSNSAEPYFSFMDVTPDNGAYYNARITRTYTNNELFDVIFPWPVTDEKLTWASHSYTFEQLNNKLPVECFRRKSENDYYVVYKTTEQGILTVFFHYLDGKCTYTHCINWSPNIDVKNYKKANNISLSEAEEFGETLKGFAKGCFDKPNMAIRSENEFVTLHPTKDGLIQIIYKLREGKLEGDYSQLFETTFDVTIENSTDFTFESMGQKFDCSLLDIDMPE